MVKRRDKSRLEVHSSSSRSAQQRQRKIKVARQCLIKAKYKAQNNTRKRFSEKPIVAFTNSTVFILDFNI